MQSSSPNERFDNVWCFGAWDVLRTTNPWCEGCAADALADTTASSADVAATQPAITDHLDHCERRRERISSPPPPDPNPGALM